MSKSEEWDRETLSLILCDVFANFLRRRGISFLDVIDLPARKRNRIFDEFKNHLGKDCVSKRKPGRPRVRDAESEAALTRVVDQIKSDFRKRFDKRLSDDDALWALQQALLRKSESLAPNEDALKQIRKTVRNEISNARRASKK